MTPLARCDARQRWIEHLADCWTCPANSDLCDRGIELAADYREATS